MLKRNKENIIGALSDAQKFIFAPMAFCALNSAIELGIIDFLDKNPVDENKIIKELNLDEYTVRTLLDVLILNNIVIKKDESYSLSKTGSLFLYDDMTRANFNFVKDVCYLGMSELTNSFKEKKPKGLYKTIKGHKTIYSALTSLPDKMLKSWYEFDHLYSDNCFEEVFEIINKKYSSIFDIGGNTGKFEKLCLKHNKNFNITMLDLSENIEKIKENADLKNCKFYPVNILDKKPNYPKIKNSAILMSQFLDCFSKKDIVKILKDLSRSMDNNSSIYILEPYTDKQKYNAAKYSLVHSSLYFTAMANGVSKFYTIKEMKELIRLSNLKIINQYDDIGSFNYTLLEIKNEVVSN